MSSPCSEGVRHKTKHAGRPLGKPIDSHSPLPTRPTRCRRKTGYGNYGPAGAKGARIIRLQQGESAALSATWIRTEDGKRLDQDSLLTLPALKRAQPACSASERPAWGAILGRSSARYSRAANAVLPCQLAHALQVCRCILAAQDMPSAVNRLPNPHR